MSAQQFYGNDKGFVPQPQQAYGGQPYYPPQQNYPPQGYAQPGPGYAPQQPMYVQQPPPQNDGSDMCCGLAVQLSL